MNQYGERAKLTPLRIAALATSALLMIGAGSARAQTPTASVMNGPIGRWVGAGVQVDWLGAPLEISRIEVTFDGAGGGTINYPSLGCGGLLTRLGSTDTVVEYRETLTSGTDNCPSGAFVSFRQASDRWVYNWSLQSDPLKRDALSSLGLPSQPGAGPDGDGVRSGVLSSDSRLAAPTAARNPAASADERAARVEGWMVPPVVVQGEAPQKATLADRMAALHVPGISVAVIHNGRIDWARSYGVAGPDGAPVTPDTLFQAASISKPLTALVTMRLAQDKKLDLDIDVSNYLKDLAIPRDPDALGHLVTVRSLLTHSAGMSLHGFAGYASGRPIPTIDQILKGEQPANSAAVRVDTTPGVLWRYSGGGYVLIRKVDETVTGQPFAELAQQIVLTPTGMDHSTFAQPLPEALKKQAAWPYGGDGQPLKEGAHTYPEVTPDGLWTTATDLARLTIQVQQTLHGRADGVLTPAITKEMLQQGGLANWGMGWGLGGSPQNPYFWHSGSNAGYKSMLFAYANGDGAVVMTNSDAGEKLAADLVRTIAYEYGWQDFRPVELAPVPLTTAQLDGLVGRYRVGRYSVMAVSRQGDALFAQTPDRPSFRIYPKSATDWFAVDPDGFTPNPNIQMSFKAPANGAATAVAMRKDGFDVVAPRLSEPQVKQIQDALAAKAADKTSSSAAEQALRRYIDQMQHGQPDYAALDPGAAYITRLLLLNFESDIAGLGRLQALEFKGAGPTGADQFVATFDHGVAKAMILLGEDGKVEVVYLMSPTFM